MFCCELCAVNINGQHIGENVSHFDLVPASSSQHYPRQDVAAQTSLRNWCRSSATLLAAVIVPNVSLMSFSHLCRGFPLLLFPATIPCIIVFSKPLWRVTWPKYFSFCRLTKLYIQFVGLVDEVNLILNSWCDELSRVYVIFCGSISSQKHLFFWYLICAVPMFHTHM